MPAWLRIATRNPWSSRGTPRTARLLTDGYIWQGFTCCNRFFDAPNRGVVHYDEAITLSKGNHADGTREDLETLKGRVLRAGRVNPVLRSWSQGSVCDKAFQQITEQFADLIIPKVW